MEPPVEAAVAVGERAMTVGRHGDVAGLAVRLGSIVVGRDGSVSWFMELVRTRS